jgi:hypothetical protein
MMTDKEREILDTCELPAGVWKHYKKGLYQVLGMGQHSETGELLVVYVALTGAHLPGPRIRCRPLTMWFETVTKKPFDGVGGASVKVQRFQFVGYEVPEEERRDLT